MTVVLTYHMLGSASMTTTALLWLAFERHTSFVTVSAV